MRKKFLLISIILIFVTYLVFNIFIYAKDPTLYIGIKSTYDNGSGYGIGNPKNAGKTLWNLRNHNSTNAGDISSTIKDVYCLKGEYGESWENNTDTIVEYNIQYDLQSDKEKLISLLGTTDANNVVKEILNSETGQYKELLWVLDNMYIPGKTDKIKLLKNLGIEYDGEYDIYYYDPSSEYDYSDKIETSEFQYLITDTDIKAVHHLMYPDKFFLSRQAIS